MLCRLLRHQALRFPHLEQLHDVFLTDEHLNLVLDLADGGTLEQLARGRMGRAGLTLSETRCACCPEHLERSASAKAAQSSCVSRSSGLGLTADPWH
jgi:hypothetical protein